MQGSKGSGSLDQSCLACDLLFSGTNRAHLSIIFAFDTLLTTPSNNNLKRSRTTSRYHIKTMQDRVKHQVSRAQGPVAPSSSCGCLSAFARADQTLTPTHSFPQASILLNLHLDNLKPKTKPQVFFELRHQIKLSAPQINPPTSHPSSPPTRWPLRTAHQTSSTPKATKNHLHS